MKCAFNLDVPETLSDLCDPTKLALLVYDMQVGIRAQAHDAPTVTENVLRVLEAARAAGLRVFFARHLSLPTALMGKTQLWTAMRHQKLSDPAQLKDGLLRSSPASALIPELAPRPEEFVFEKITMSAFEGTLLPIALRDCGIGAFAIVGIAMEVGIEPTVRHAADLGFLPVIVTDACGAANPAAATRSLESLAFAGTSIATDVATFVDLLAKHKRVAASPEFAAS